VTAEMIAPGWMHELITAEQYDGWSAEQSAGIEIVDGIVVVTPSATLRHNRVAKMIANALEAAGAPSWNADLDIDLRLQDVPLHNRRPDVIVYSPDAIDVVPMRPEHVLLVGEVVSPGSETTDRSFKALEYARAGIRYYWRVEDAATGLPIVHTYVLDQASQAYQATEVFPGVIKAVAPFPVELDLRAI
jgi:Uma2 family endonuclease